MPATAPLPTALLLTALDAARAMAVSPRTLWTLTAPRGPIPVVRIGRAVRYDLESLRRYIAAAQQGARP
jgi:hypothetical protein